MTVATCPEQASATPVAICGSCGTDLFDAEESCPRCGGEPSVTWTLQSLADAVAGRSQTPQPEPSPLSPSPDALSVDDILGDMQESLAQILENSVFDEASLGDPHESSPGLALNRAERYEVLGTLGHGAMGLVLKVRDTALDELLALKILDPKVGDFNRVVELFKQEVRIARRIHHPNVARIHDLFQWHFHVAISQEYIPGQDLTDVIGRRPLQPEQIVHYMRHICSALQAAHDIGVVHRDLKPSNIRVDVEDRPRVLDFGLAVLTGSDRRGSERLLGTPSYMAPEQIRKPDTVDQRADIYSLGVILFRMVTGRLPFRADSTQELLVRHLTEPAPSARPVNPDVTPELDQVILRCLEKEPDDRYGTVQAVYEDVRQALSKGPPSGAHRRPPKRRTGTVLVVDDNAALRTIVRTHLEDLGIEKVAEAANGYDGVDTALKESPDMILLDVMMPVLDGREALRIIKSNPMTADTPVVMITSADDIEEEMLFREMGAEMSLTKPIKRDILELLLARFVPQAATNGAGASA